MLLLSGPAAAVENPLSAIDWLSQSVTAPTQETPGEGILSNSATSEMISVQPLGQQNPDAVGLLPASVSGLPTALWGVADSGAVAKAIGAIPPVTLPALAALNRTVLLAESEVPEGSDGSLLLARVDKLLEIGALDDALALLDRAGPTSPALFRRWFDVALLTGTENRACQVLRQRGDIAPSYQARIFCLARNGDWNAAALTLNSAESLGVLGPDEYALIARFLDPELFEGDAPMQMPERITPLVFRMHEAIGEPLATRDQPRAFSFADLRQTASWESRIIAGERLARVGAISENRLLGLYSERPVTKSGGIWDRVVAVQRFEGAVQARDPLVLNESLPQVWDAMKSQGLERAFAQLFAEQLQGMTLQDPAAALVRDIALLSDRYENEAQKTDPINGAEPGGPEQRFVTALALGIPLSAPAPSDRASAVRAGFDGGAVDAKTAENIAQGRFGQVILGATLAFEQGRQGELTSVTNALRALREIGLEDSARQAALQFLLLDGQG